MMKNLFKILFLSLFMFSCGDNLVEEVKERYDNGKLKVVEYYKKVGDNQELVRKIEYYENGQIKGEENYYHQKRDGKWVRYDEEGNISYERCYEMGKRVDCPDDD